MWLNPADAELDDLLTVLKQQTNPADYPCAERIEQQVPVYDAARIRSEDRRTVQAEFAKAFADGPGIIVLQGAFGNDAVDAATAVVLRGPIVNSTGPGSAAGDHFAKPGAERSVWNALEKLAIAAPEVFAGVLRQRPAALVASAWLDRRTR